MSLEIISLRFRTEWHLHRCPICKKIRREPNQICGKTSGDHIFACIECLQGYRLRMGTDILLDVYLDQSQLDRFNEFSPDEKATELDQRDQARREAQLKELVARAKELPPAKPKSELEICRDTHEEIEKLRDEAEVITFDEAQAELERLKKEEAI